MKERVKICQASQQQSAHQDIIAKRPVQPSVRNVFRHVDVSEKFTGHRHQTESSEPAEFTHIRKDPPIMPFQMSASQCTDLKDTRRSEYVLQHF